MNSLTLSIPLYKDFVDKQLGEVGATTLAADLNKVCSVRSDANPNPQPLRYASRATIALSPDQSLGLNIADNVDWNAQQPYMAPAACVSALREHIKDL